MARDYVEYEFFLKGGGSEFQIVEVAHFRSDINTYMRGGTYTGYRPVKHDAEQALSAELTCWQIEQEAVS